MALIVDVIGMKCFKGIVQGNRIDSGSIFAIVKMDERFNRKDADGTNWKFGHAVEEWRLPNSESVMKLSHLKPSIKNPVTMKLETERVSNGTETKEVVIDCLPVNGATIDLQTGEIKQVADVPAAAPPAQIRKSA